MQKNCVNYCKKQKKITILLKNCCFWNVNWRNVTIYRVLIESEVVLIKTD